jgi:hypothetical protein
LSSSSKYSARLGDARGGRFVLAQEYATPEIQTEIIAALSKTAMATLYRYDALDHAFARPGGQHFDADGAALAKGRTAEFLRGILYPASVT